ncbi:MAG: hypothetical protein ABIQ99_03195 [Thermoflexales bacterium]
MRSYQNKLTGFDGLSAKHETGLTAILETIEDILEGKKETFDNGLIDRFGK